MPVTTQTDDCQDSCPAMLFALQLQGNGRAMPQSHWIEEGHQLWLHGDRQGKDCYEWLMQLAVPETIIETLLRPESRPRMLFTPQGILLNLRVLNMNPGQDQEDMVSLRMWIEKDRLITIRQLRVFSVQEIREELLSGKGSNNLQELIVDLVGRITDRISIYVDELEEVIESYDERIEHMDPTHARREVSGIRRQAATVRRYLAPQREALEKFAHAASSIMDEYHSHLMQDTADRIVRYVEDLDLVREQAQVLLEELTNRVSQEQNSRMYVLSIVAAIFLPISFVTGMFGMNVGGLPGLENQNGFFLVSILMGLISGGILYWFRRKKWM